MHHLHCLGDAALQEKKVVNADERSLAEQRQGKDGAGEFSPEDLKEGT